MRISILLAALLVSFSAFGSGRLLLEPYYNTTLDNESGVKFGLSIYENLGKSGFYYNGYAGLGLEQQDSRTDIATEWSVVKNGVGYYWGKRITSEVGLELKRGGDCPGTCAVDDLERIIYLRAGYKLW